MKSGAKTFLGSFVIAFFAFSLIAAIIITLAYSALSSPDPEKKESNLLVVGLDEGERVFSITVINVDPIRETVSFLSIPDNTLIGENQVLQSLYDSKNVLRLKGSVETLLGISISRYMIFTPEKIGKISDRMGSFEYSIKYPFISGDSELVGTVLMNGKMARDMFSYQGYDMKKASLSEIGISYLQSILSKFANEQNIDDLLAAVLDNGFCGSQYTNLSEEELQKYASVLRGYPSMLHRNVELEGEYNETSARKYFSPLKIKSDKNIFEK